MIYICDIFHTVLAILSQFIICIQLRNLFTKNKTVLESFIRNILENRNIYNVNEYC